MNNNHHFHRSTISLSFPLTILISSVRLKTIYPLTLLIHYLSIVRLGNHYQVHRSGCPRRTYTSDARHARRTSQKKLGKNSIGRENKVNLPTIKRIISKFFNTWYYALSIILKTFCPASSHLISILPLQKPIPVVGTGLLGS